MVTFKATFIKVNLLWKFLLKWDILDIFFYLYFILRKSGSSHKLRRYALYPWKKVWVFYTTETWFSLYKQTGVTPSLFQLNNRWAEVFWFRYIYKKQKQNQNLWFQINPKSGQCWSGEWLLLIPQALSHHLQVSAHLYFHFFILRSFQWPTCFVEDWVVFIQLIFFQPGFHLIATLPPIHHPHRWHWAPKHHHKCHTKHSHCARHAQITGYTPLWSN